MHIKQFNNIVFVFKIINIKYMKIIIKCLGHSKKNEFSDIEQEYIKKTPNNIEIMEYAPCSIKSPLLAKTKDNEILFSKINHSDIYIALDEAGECLSSKQFSKLIEKYKNSSQKTLQIVIGGAYGLSDKIKNKAKHVISLSAMTFPHKLARLILIEQIYRAFMIINNHPYHKE